MKKKNLQKILKQKNKILMNKRCMGKMKMKILKKQI